MVRHLSAAQSSEAALDAILTRITRVAHVHYLLTVAPVADERGAYRVVQTMDPSAGGGVQRRARDMSPEAIASLPVHRGGIIAALMEDGRPKFATELDAAGDPVLHGLPEGATRCMAVPIFNEGRIEQWAFTFSDTSQVAVQRDVANSIMTTNLLGFAARHMDALKTIGRLHGQLRDQFDAVARVQQALLPRRTPDVPGIEIATSYLPSDQAGGDSFRFDTLPDGRLTVQQRLLHQIGR